VTEEPASDGPGVVSVTLSGVIVAVRAVPRNRDACVARVRAAVIEAVAGKLRGGVVGRWAVSR